MTLNMQVYPARCAVILCLLAILLCTPLPSQAAEAVYEGSGWGSPEDTVGVYLEGLKEQNVQKMISAHAVETYIDGFDLAAQIARNGAYTGLMVPSMPNSNAIMRGLNIESRRNEIARTALWQMTTICLPEQDLLSKPTVFSGDSRAEDAQTFVDGLDAALGAIDFSTLEVLYFNPPEEIAEMYGSEKNQANLHAQATCYGADELRSVVAVFVVDGKLGALCCDTIRYGDQWYMFRSNGNIAALIGLSADTGGMVAVDYEDLTALRDQLDANEQALLDALLVKALSHM